MSMPEYLSIGQYLAESVPNTRRFLRNWNAIFRDDGDHYPAVLANAFFWVEHTQKSWIGLNNFERFLKNSSETGSLFDFLEQYPSAFEILWTSLSKTPHLAGILIRNPDDFYWLLEESSLGRKLTMNDVQSQFYRTVFSFKSPYRRHSFLHRLHRRHFLRIAMRDILHIADFQRTITDLSNLAVGLVQTVTQMVLDSYEEKGKLPETAYSVIALGKLGGGELNYSSDIDLMFVYDEDGQLPGGESYNIVFQKISEEISRILNEQSEHGALYRVDTRLRPDGASGILCQSLSAYLHYYENRGRLWERQMLIKARAIAGDVEFGNEVLEQFIPFVYPRQIQYPLQDIVVQRQRSETQSENGLNVKTDPGGIRDIEFIVQALQLQFGGREESIRDESTLSAIEKLSKKEKFLAKGEAIELRKNYIFLRQVEHALQLQENLQVHVLPEEEPDNLLIASLMNYPAYTDLYNDTAASMSRVREIYNQVFNVESAEQDSDYSSYTEKDWQEYFENYQYQNPQKAAFQIQSLATGRFPRNHDSATREAFWDMCPHLLESLKEMPSPANVLTDFERIVRSYQAVSSLYTIFSHNPDLLSLLVNLIGHASKTVQWIIQQPELIDTLIALPDEDLTTQDFQRLLEPLDDFSIGQEHWRKKAIELRNTMLLTIISQWLIHDKTIRDLSSIYSVANRMLLSKALTFWLGDYRKHLSVLIAGSAASETMVFSSDFDVVFLLDDESDTLDVSSSIEEFIQETEQYSAKGKLFSFDFRLRPEGKSAPLILPRTKYVEYVRNRMSAWEFQAMGKSEYLWGNNQLAEKTYDVIKAELHDRLETSQFWQDLHSLEKEAIRQKIQLKRENYVHHPGGLFATQNTLEWNKLIENYASFHLEKTRIENLKETINFLYKIKWFISMNMEGSSDTMPRAKEKIDILARLLGFRSQAGFLEELHKTLDTNKAINNSYRNRLLEKFK